MGQQAPDLFYASNAWFSDCELYRYDMWRRWSDDPLLTFLMHNPSTGSPEEFDATNIRCAKRASLLGFGGVRFLNLFAYRTPYPSAMV